MTDTTAALKAIAAEARTGTSSSALLSGAAGTAGAKAAETLAASLGTTVYRIDLAAVASRYIGETEKNLSVLLAEAESHDRYANLDVASLLGRIEAYSGVVLLATNRRMNLDATYARRLRRVIDDTPR